MMLVYLAIFRFFFGLQTQSVFSIFFSFLMDLQVLPSTNKTLPKSSQFWSKSLFVPSRSRFVRQKSAKEALGQCIEPATNETTALLVAA